MNCNACVVQLEHAGKKKTEKVKKAEKSKTERRKRRKNNERVAKKVRKGMKSNGYAEEMTPWGRIRTCAQEGTQVSGMRTNGKVANGTHTLGEVPCACGGGMAPGKDSGGRGKCSRCKK
jgi:hypothetical protein